MYLLPAYFLTCKLSHFWFKVKFGQVNICGNLVVILMFLFLEPPPVVVDAAIL